ncbi:MULTISPECIES: tetratricopeptide repeat protein [Frankia]|uniref:tetratricopeptide repeat protein n=1 Tax=Frankia sp. ArI3 TaxID=1858 RepID=UPI000D788398
MQPRPQLNSYVEATAHNLGVSLNELGEHSTARALRDDALTRQRTALGSDHPHTLATTRALRWTLDQLGKRPSEPQRSPRWRRAWDRR